MIYSIIYSIIPLKNHISHCHISHSIPYIIPIVFHERTIISIYRNGHNYRTDLGVRNPPDPHTPENMALYGTVHTSVLQFPLKPPATRRLCESWRLLTCIYIILCIFLGPWKNVHRNQNYRTELLQI